MLSLQSRSSMQQWPACFCHIQEGGTPSKAGTMIHIIVMLLCRQGNGIIHVELTHMTHLKHC